MNIPIFNIMNCDKLCVNLFMGFDISGDKFPFSVGNGRRRYNSADCATAQPVIKERFLTHGVFMLLSL